METTTFVKWSKYLSTPYGRVSRGLISEIPSKEAREFCSQGKCEVPPSVEVMYRGEPNKNSYVLNWRKLRITFLKDRPRVIPSQIAREIMHFACFEIKRVKS